MTTQTQRITKTVTESKITFTFPHGKTVTVDPEEFNDHITNKATIHGFAQKLGDSYAGNTGPEDAYNKFMVMYESLQEGVWNPGRSNIGGSFVEALARATNQSIDDCIQLVATMTKETLAATKKHPDVLRAMAEIKLEALEKVTKTDPNAVDLSGLFESIQS